MRCQFGNVKFIMKNGYIRNSTPVKHLTKSHTRQKTQSTHRKDITNWNCLVINWEKILGQGLERKEKINGVPHRRKEFDF